MVQYASRIKNQAVSGEAVRKLFNSMSDPSLITFGGGSPAWDTFPVDDIRKVCNDVFQTDGMGRYALAYNDPMGTKELREVVRDIMLPRRGMKCDDLDEIMIVNGGLETMNLTCQVFIEKGDVILVESPSFVQSIQVFELFEAKCIEVDCDDYGMLMDDLEKKYEQYNPKMIYVISSFQNPAGRTMTLERRKALAEFANTHDVIILEDDPYVELRYSGEEIPSIKSFDTAGHVIFANSFSKIFSPGARLGYCFGPKEIVNGPMYDAKTATNSQTSTTMQVICAEYFKQGYYDKHIEMCKKFYTEKRDFAIECMEKYMPEGTKITKPDGGLFIWVQLPEGMVNTTDLLLKALDRHVAFIAGEGFYIGLGKGTNCMRCSFGQLSLENIDKGLKILGDLIKEEAWK